LLLSIGRKKRYLNLKVEKLYWRFASRTAVQSIKWLRCGLFETQEVNELVPEWCTDVRGMSIERRGEKGEQFSVERAERRNRKRCHAIARFWSNTQPRGDTLSSEVGGRIERRYRP
jgi:hypothetical protein